MDIRIAQGMAEVAPEAWNSLEGTDNPFLRHEFLHALEAHGCVDPDDGWQPSHLLLHQDDRLLAAAPAYLKGHSWGEFVFDWSWADAHARYGLPYYPKLVVAVPYSPATGPRVLVAPGVAPSMAADALAAAAQRIVIDNRLSSAHWLFTDTALAERLRAADYDLRTGCQFHWSNRGYRDFDHFLSFFSSKKRKNVRQERSRVRAAGVTFDWLPGQDVSDAQWRAFEGFYRRTFHAHGNVPVMSAAFFRDIGRMLRDRVLLVLAYQRGEPVAGALLLRSADTLYGRYWGSAIELNGLHFETCYYQGIDYCIRHGLARFEPGAQGEHKVPRGFLPVPTRSAHWLRNDALRRAVSDFLTRERPHVEAYLEDMRVHSPFRAADPAG
jgi:predicted N-acyltransferase